MIIIFYPDPLAPLASLPYCLLQNSFYPIPPITISIPSSSFVFPLLSSFSSAHNPQSPFSSSSSSSSFLSSSSSLAHHSISYSTPSSIPSPTPPSHSPSSQPNLSVDKSSFHSPSLCSPKSLTVFYFNARSLLPKIDDLILFCSNYSPHIICVVETWLSSEISDSEILIPNYMSFRLDRSRHGGGIAVFVKSSLSVSALPFTPNLEFLPPSIKPSNHYSFTLGTFYRPPNSDSALRLLNDHISIMSPNLLHNLFLVGDFNVDFLQSSSLCNNLLDLTNCLGLKQIICEPTHFSHVGSPSLIDLVFVPSDFSCPSYVHPPISSSDHLSILFSVPLAHSVKHSPSASRFRKVWLYNKANFDSANLLLSSLPWDSLFSSNDVNFCWSIFKEAFLEVMRRTIPSKFVFSSYSLPWGNNHLLACIKKRNHLFRLAKKFKSPSYMSLYRSCRNKTLSYQRKLKASFFNRLSLSSSSSKSFWSLYSKLKKKPSTLPNLTHNGLNASDPISKANMMNNFFSQCFNSSVPPLSLSDNLPSAYCSPDLLCTPQTIIQLISQLPAITSPGLDRISSKMLKATSHSISVPLSVLFNLSLSSGIFPTDWKSSVVIPVPKQSASISSPSNYRPISLLPLVSKLLERHVFNWLYKYCQSHNILHNNQFGFRPSFSTESALITTTHSWFSLLDSKFSICAVFFDLCKAFDSIPH